MGAAQSAPVASPRDPACVLKAGEFVTTQAPGKSIYRTRLVKVTYLFG